MSFRLVTAPVLCMFLAACGTAARVESSCERDDDCAVGLICLGGVCGELLDDVLTDTFDDDLGGRPTDDADSHSTDDSAGDSAEVDAADVESQEDGVDVGGDVLPNACGGIDELPAAPGDRCGPCGDGVFACLDDRTLACEGATALNACGGCTELDAEPGASCGDCGGGQYTCVGEDEVECVDGGGLNACGGCAVLEGVPESACGPCLDGEWTCADDGLSVECVGSTAPNACGGCFEPSGEVGASCGVCGGGELACDEAIGDVRCVGERAPNACGGCAPLSSDPGTSCGFCGAGVWVCSEDGESLACEGDVRNACGGCATLASEPGDPCGECGLDSWVCDGEDSVRCDGSTVANSCGGCDASVDALLGEACGSCGTWACDPVAVGRTRCDDPGANLCGGCAELPASPGDDCGRCGLDTYECSSDADRVECDGDTAQNACGGCTTLASVPGSACSSASCGPAGGIVTCSGTERTVCDCDGQVCGNGLLEGTEQCDDGNTRARDYCSPTCTIEYASTPGTLPGTCTDPIELPVDSRSSWNLCGRGDDEDNIAGEVGCIDGASPGEDLVFVFSLARRTNVSLYVRDVDSLAAVDAVVYLRTECDDEDSQVVCGDDVACDEAISRVDCINGYQPREGRIEALLDAGTYYAIVDHYSYRLGDGTAFGCGNVQLLLRAD